MATSKSPRRRSAKSTQISRHTRAAHENAEKLLGWLSSSPAFHVLKENPESKQLLSELNADVTVLKDAPKLRIGAARRLQGASSRRRTASQALFNACAEIRRRIKLRYRGPRHLQLRRQFGEGLAASPAKPETVLAFAEKILSAAPERAAELREVRVGPPTLQRVEGLRENLRECRPERIELRTARKEVSEHLVQIAERVNGRCQALIAVAARLCPQVDLSTFLPPPKPRPARQRPNHRA